MKILHPKQSQILNFLKNNVGNDLILNSLYDELDIDSPGVLYYHLAQLEKKGYLKRNPSNSRDYIILDSPEEPITYINKYGTAQCGPNGFILDGAPIGRIPITSSFLRFPASEAFIVEARGKSMEPKIQEGDTIIAKKQNIAQSGDIVVCVHNKEVKIKQFLRIGKRIVLHSLNEEYPLIEVQDDNEFKIEGVVKNILSTL